MSECISFPLRHIRDSDFKLKSCVRDDSRNLQTHNLSIWRYHCLGEVAFLVSIFITVWCRASEVFVHLPDPCSFSNLVYRSLESTLSSKFASNMIFATSLITKIIKKCEFAWRISVLFSPCDRIMMLEIKVQLGFFNDLWNDVHSERKKVRTFIDFQRTEHWYH